jgi:hypothetical protein
LLQVCCGRSSAWRLADHPRQLLFLAGNRPFAVKGLDSQRFSRGCVWQLPIFNLSLCRLKPVLQTTQTESGTFITAVA